MVEKDTHLRHWALIDTPQYQIDFLRFNVDLIVPSGRTITSERLDKNFPCRWDTTPANYFIYVPTDPNWKDHIKK